jgi:hypothetical protein
MNPARSSLRWSAPVIIAVGIASCTSTSDGDDATPGRPTSSRIAFAEQWSAAIHDMGMFPVFPPTEDAYVGDVYVFSAPPDFGSLTSADGLRTAATPRWKSLQVLSQLESEYRERPTWSSSADALSEAGDTSESIYRAGRVPVRHRVVGLRSMLKVTLAVHDLEPFIPIEVAPLINGPATPARLAVSVQAGDSETYSLSVDTIVEQLLEIAEEQDGTKFTLKPEHLANLSLAADPRTGRAYLVTVTQVLYVRSVEATIRRREPTPEGDSADGVPEQSEPATEGPAEPVESAAAVYGADPAVAAILRGKAMNEAFNQSGSEDGVGEGVQIVMATDDSITLRRTWPYPLAVAIRGITLEVDTSTGAVLRMGPLGIELPTQPPPEPKPDPNSVSEPSATDPGEGS